MKKDGLFKYRLGLNVSGSDAYVTARHFEWNLGGFHHPILLLSDLSYLTNSLGECCIKLGDFSEEVLYGRCGNNPRL